MTDALSIPLVGGGRRAKAAWIVSPAFDLAFLIFAPLLTIPIIAGVYFRIPWLAIGGGIILAFAHYGSSFAFYFWKENQEYYRARWIAFYAGPVILATIYLSLLGFHVPYVIQFVLFFWNTFHVSRQNCGILSIYRNGSGVTDADQRNAANRAIIAVSFFLSLWNIGTHKEVTAIFAMISPNVGVIARAVTGVVAAVAVVQLIIVVRRRQQSMGASELLFLLASLAFFYPYLFIHSSEIATFAMLLPHYVQYMAIVWMLHRRKFGQSNEGVPFLLGLMSRKLRVLIPILFAAGFFFYMLHVTSARFGSIYLYETLYLLIAFEHFYLDGLIWSFKQPHVRKTIGKYLRPAAQAQPATA